MDTNTLRELCKDNDSYLSLLPPDMRDAHFLHYVQPYQLLYCLCCKKKQPVYNPSRVQEFRASYNKFGGPTNVATGREVWLGNCSFCLTPVRSYAKMK